MLTEKQAVGTFERAKGYFQEYRDNAAMVEINRLLASNASAGLKKKANSLRAFVDSRFPDGQGSAQPMARYQPDPALYDGCYVAWKGMAANVAKSGLGAH